MRIDPRLTLLLATICLMAACTHTRDPLADWLGERRVEGYRPPDAAEAAALAAAFEAALREGGDAHWTALGYETRTFDDGSAMREAAPAQRGWGAYVFRTGPAAELIVQAPHADSDLQTGEIALATYRARGARALALNSAHRRWPQADQANTAGAPFALLAAEAVAQAPRTVIVQLHGYGDATAREHGLTPQTAVVSNGTRRPDAALLALAGCLRAAGFDARVFPGEAPYPGGTRNAVRRAIAARGAGRFVHLELGRDLRDVLVRDPQRVEAFAACL